MSVLLAAKSTGRRLRTASLQQWDQDRKSTRLNSSHLVISYAVFCLKKKNLLGFRVAPDLRLVFFDIGVCSAGLELELSVVFLVCVDSAASDLHLLRRFADAHAAPTL